MRLQIFKDCPSRIPSKKLQSLFELADSREGRKHWKADVNVIFTDDRKIRGLNRKYRNKDRRTDVLSFVLDEPNARGDIFGEIYISVQTARRQAEEYGTSLTQEFLRLFCHGLLHLYGYDHMDDDEADGMMKLEKRYLDRLSEGSG